jgi:hypothetical protein
MRIAYFLGRAMELQPLALPPSLQPVNQRAEFVSRVDELLVVNDAGGLLVGRTGALEWAAFGERLRRIAEAAAQTLPEVPEPLSQMSITLRLWAGCIDAAKAIAHETRSGSNTAAIRAQVFSALIDPIAQSDELYRAGVEAGPAFKSSRDDSYSMDGVPDASAVRRYIAATE